MKKWLYSLLLLLLVCSIAAHAQSDAEDFVKNKAPNILPPAPNVASLGKFGNVPVGLYTGVPNITIPIYTIQDGTFTMPINLAYHSGGVRVDEIASNVGLEWSLMAGGSISRVVKGGPDELTEGYMQPGNAAKVAKFNKNQMTATEKTAYMKLVADGGIDAEPDLFQINLPGIASEKFVYTPTYGYLVIPQKKLKIEGDPIQGFIVTLTNGDRYYFTEAEETEVIPLGSRTGTGPLPYINPRNYTASWHLKQVLLTNGKIISFTYTSSKISPEYNGSVSRFYCEHCGATPVDCEGNTVFSKEYFIETHSKTTTYQKKIKSIDFPLGSISFNYATTGRLDLPGDSALVGVTISNNSISIKKVALTNSYHSGRLFLDKVSLLNASGIEIGSYLATYSNPDALPARNSFSQDTWGFYNGAVNSSFLENRATNPTLTLYGVLTKLTYPTGGYSTFEYEANTFSRIYPGGFISDTTRAVADTSVALMSNGETGDPTTSQPFFVPYKQSFYVNANVKGSGTYAKILKQDGTAVFDLRGIGTTLNHVYQPIELDPGYYSVSVFNYEAEFIANINFQFKKYTGSYTVSKNRFAGGARVKKITDFDHLSGKSEITNFNYDIDTMPGVSSGVINNSPVYTFQRKISKSVKCGDNEGPGYTEWTYYDVTQSESGVSTVNTNGSHIGYSMVTVTKGPNGENGKSVSRFSDYYADHDIVFTTFPFVKGSTIDYARGLLLSQTDFKFQGGAYIKTKTINTHYAHSYYDVNKEAAGVGIGYDLEDKISVQYNTYIVQPYYQGAYFVFPDNITTIAYENLPLLEEVKNYYDNPNNLMQTKGFFYNSKGDSVTTTFKYPHDFQGTAPVYDSMLKRNMIDIQIEKTLINNVKTLRREKTSYALWQTGKQIAISDILSQILPFPENMQLSYTRYDDAGNPLEFITKDGIRSSFIWGYNNELPVAKITGAKYDSAVLGLNLNIIKNPASDLQLRTELQRVRDKYASTNVQVISNTYNPLFGITSETDPAGRITYYEYDEFSRLKAVKDKDGKILKLYEYQYSKPITQ